MTIRTLVLRPERLTDLTAGELAAVAGAAPSYDQCPPSDTHYCVTRPVERCVLESLACA